LLPSPWIRVLPECPSLAFTEPPVFEPGKLEEVQTAPVNPMFSRDC